MWEHLYESESNTFFANTEIGYKGYQVNLFLNIAKGNDTLAKSLMTLGTLIALFKESFPGKHIFQPNLECIL